MANLYLQLLEDAQKLPAAYQAMGMQVETLNSTYTGVSFSGWQVCQYAYKMNEDGPEWWSNDLRLYVDVSGTLWNVELGEQYEPYPTPKRTSSVNLHKVSAGTLRMWHTNGWEFNKIKDSIAAMI